MNIAIYARVSTQSQAKQETIQSQIEALREYAQTHDLTITYECTDNGVSGSTLEREGLDELRDLVLAGKVSGVLALSPDRLSRSQFDQMVLMKEFRKRGIKIFFTNQQFEDTPAGNLMLQIQGAISEYERATIRDRMRRGQRHSVKKGQVIAGNTPYGYSLVRKTETTIARWKVNEAEAEIVRLIYELYVKQGMKGTQIAHHLNDNGIPPRSGAKWWAQVVYNILKNESYLGIAYMYKNKKVKPKRRSKINQQVSTENNTKKPTPIEDRIGVSVPKLIDQQTFDVAQELLKKNTRCSRRNNKVNEYLLRGLVVCGECGSVCSGYVSNKKAYYNCGAKRNKNITTKPHDDVRIAQRQKHFDERVWQGLTELLQDPENLRVQIETRLPKSNNALVATQKAQAEIEKEWQKLDAQEKRILDAYREAIIDIDELRDQKRKIAEKRASLQTQQEAAQSKLQGSKRPEITIDMLGDISARFQRVMAKANFATREKITNLLVRSVILHPNKAVVRGNIPVMTVDALTKSPTTGLLLWRSKSL